MGITLLQQNDKQNIFENDLHLLRARAIVLIIIMLNVSNVLREYIVRWIQLFWNAGPLVFWRIFLVLLHLRKIFYCMIIHLVVVYKKRTIYKLYSVYINVIHLFSAISLSGEWVKKRVAVQFLNIFNIVFGCSIRFN